MLFLIFWTFFLNLDTAAELSSPPPPPPPPSASLLVVLLQNVEKNVLDRNLAVLRLLVWIPSHVLVASQNVFGPCILACVFNEIALSFPNDFNLFKYLLKLSHMARHIAP